MASSSDDWRSHAISGGGSLFGADESEPLLATFGQPASYGHHMGLYRYGKRHYHDGFWRWAFLLCLGITTTGGIFAAFSGWVEPLSKGMLTLFC